MPASLAALIDDFAARTGVDAVMLARDGQALVVRGATDPELVGMFGSLTDRGPIEDVPLGSRRFFRMRAKSGLVAGVVYDPEARPRVGEETREFLASAEVALHDGGRPDGPPSAGEGSGTAPPPAELELVEAGTTPLIRIPRRA